MDESSSSESVSIISTRSSESDDNTVAIGINLGTSEVSASIWRNEKVEAIPNFRDESGMTPSYISFNDTGYKIGFPALRQLELGLNSSNIIFDAKRLLGRKWDDPIIQNYRQYWPFKIIKNVDNNPEFKVLLLEETRHFLPERVILLLLKHIKVLVQDYLDDPTVTVFNAVIAVPATFNYFQRQAIRQLGELAGLKVLRIVNDNLATAITYGHGQQLTSDGKLSAKNLLIFDFGAGFLSVSVLRCRSGYYMVKTTFGDSNLGGRDFDNRLFKYFSRKFQHNNSLKNNPTALVRFLRACEEAKLDLSFGSETCFNYTDVEDLNVKFSARITRTQFENLCTDLLDAALLPVMKVLVDANMDKSQIDNVVIMGGSSRIPKVQQMLQDFFDGKELTKLDSKETVSNGAALMSVKMSKITTLDHVYWEVKDVIPFSLGVETSDGYVSVLITRYTTVPTIRTETAIVNSSPSSTSHPVLIRVYEIENVLSKDNLLYTLNFNAAASESEIELTFEVSSDSTLSVTAFDKSAGQNEEISICLDKMQMLCGVGNGDQVICLAEYAESDSSSEKDSPIQYSPLPAYIYGRAYARKSANQPVFAVV